MQVREKTMPDGELLQALGLAREITRRLGVPLVVNDRADLALLVEADLLHVGQEDLPVAAVRRLGLPAGLSTHTPEQIDAADSDYIGVGPVFATATKPGRSPVGLDLVRYAAEHARVPWFAIGGIDRSNLANVIAAGASRIAVVRAIGDSVDPERVARELREVVRPGE